MTLNTLEAPHIRHSRNTRNLMLDVLLMLLVLYAMAYYYHGPRVLTLGLCSVAVSCAADVAGTLLRRGKPHIRDLSPAVTGLILPLLMPASVPFYVVVTAAVVAIGFAKQPFGGVGHNVFNPVAAGFSFVCICFTDIVFTYPQPLQQRLPAFGELGEYLTGISPAFTLQLGALPTYELTDMAMGNYPGPMGATNILVILACLIYLVFRNTVRWEMPVSFICTVSLFAWLFPRTDVTRMQSVALELMTGFLLFSGVFLLGDPVTTPKRDFSKVVFGAVTGIVVMLFRYFGKLEESFTFAILVMNASVWAIDMLVEKLYSKIRRRRLEAVDGKKIQKKA